MYFLDLLSTQLLTIVRLLGYFVTVAIDGVPPVAISILWGLGVGVSISIDSAAVDRRVVLWGLGVWHSAAHDHWIPLGVWSYRSSLLTQPLVRLYRVDTTKGLVSI